MLSLLELEDTILTSYMGNAWFWNDSMDNAAQLANGEWKPLGEPDALLDFYRLNGRVFIGGEAGLLLGSSMPGVRAWSNGTIQALPNSPFTQPVDVSTGAYWQGHYYFGGNTWGELGSHDIVRFDGDSTWSGVGGGMGPGWLNAHAGFGDSLYAGGYFLAGGNNLSTHLQLFDGTQWQPFFPQVEFIGQVRDIQVYQGALYVSGIYHFVGESTWYGLLRFDGRDLCAIGGSMPAGDNGPIAFFQNNLYMALAAQFPGLEYEFIGYLPLDDLVPDTCITVVNTSVAEHTEATLGLFPNPGREHLSLTSPLEAWPAEVEVRDMAGRLVHRERLGANAALSTGAWAAGTYTVLLLDPRGTVRRGTWVKLP